MSILRKWLVNNNDDVKEYNNIQKRISAMSGYLWKLKRNERFSNILIPQWNKRYVMIEGINLKWYIYLYLCIIFNIFIIFI
jgi:hypothetical protein